MRALRAIAVAGLLVPAAQALGQTSTGGFLTINGTDTTTIERFSQTGRVLTSDIDFRRQGQRVHFVVRFRADGTAEHAELTNTEIAGGAVTSITYEFGADSILIHRVDMARPTDLVVGSPGPLFAWMPASLALIEHAVKATSLKVGDSTVIRTVNIRQMSPPAPAAIRRFAADSAKILNGTFARLSPTLEILRARSTGNGLDFVRIP